MNQAERIPDFDSKLSVLAERWSHDADIAAAFLHLGWIEDTEHFAACVEEWLAGQR